MSEWNQITAKPEEEEDEHELPNINVPGRILVKVEYVSDSVYNWYYDVLDYDSDTSVFWIKEGVGFNWWLDNNVEFPGPGTYLIEGIFGSWHTSYGPNGRDDDEEWDWKYLIRVDGQTISPLLRK